MYNYKSIKKLISGFVIGLILILSIQLVYATDSFVDSGDINLYKAFPGKIIKQKINLNGISSDIILTDFAVKGEIQNWVTLFLEKNSDSSAELFVLIDVPEKAELRDYHGNIIVAVEKNAGIFSGQSDTVIMRFNVNLLLTDKIESGIELIEFNFLKTEEGKPLSFMIDLENLGNQEIDPDFEVVIYGDSGSNYVIDDQISLLAFEEKKEFHLSNVVLPQGNYHALLSLNLLEEQFQKNIDFMIYPKGSLTKRIELIDVGFGGTKNTDEVLLVSNIIRNTGEAGVNAKVVSEINLDGVAIEKIVSEELFIANNQVRAISNEFVPVTSGKYLIKSWLEFENTATQVVENLVVIKDFDSSVPLSFNKTSLFILFISLVVVTRFIMKARIKNGS